MADARIILTPRFEPSTAYLEWVVPTLSNRTTWDLGPSMSCRHAFPELRRWQAQFRRRDARQGH